MNDIRRKMHHLLEKIAYTPGWTPKLAVAPVPVRVRTAPTPALAGLQRRTQAARIVH